MSALEEGRGGALFVGGEARFGKSRLLAQFATAAEGFEVVRISCEQLATEARGVNDAVLLQLEPVSRRRSTVVLIDDLHLANSSDLDAVGFFVHAASDARVAIVATHLLSAGRAPALGIRCCP